MSMAKMQFQLPLTVKRCRRSRPTSFAPGHLECPLPQRVGGLDQMLGTHDVERITGRHRCTIYRWVCAGTFPPKRAGGGRGWLRSDIERWLSGGDADEMASRSWGCGLPRKSSGVGP